MAKTDLASLVVKLEAQTADYQAKMISAQKQNERFQSSTKKSLGAVESSFRSLTRTAQGLISLYAVERVVDFVKKNVEAADAIGEIAEQAGIGTDQMQRLQFAMKAMTQASAEQTTRGLSTFNENLGKARTSSLALQRAFLALGVDLKATTEDSLEVAFRTLAKIADPALRAAKAAEIFGDRFGPKVAGALGQGQGAIERYMAAATGIVSPETIQGASDLNDKLDELAKKFTAEETEAVLKNAAAIETLAKSYGTLVGWVFKALGTLQDWGSQFGTWLEQQTRAAEENPNQRAGASGSWGDPPAGAEGKWEDLKKAKNDVVVVDLAALAAAKKAKEAQDQLTKSIDSQIKTLEMQAETMGMTEAQASMYRLEMEATEKGLHGLTLEQYAAASAAVDSIERQKKALDDFDIALQTDADEQADLLARTREFSEALARDAEEKFGAMSVFVEQAARNMQDSLAEFLFDPFKDGLKGMLNGLLDVLRQMVAQMAAADLFGALAKVGGGGTSGGVLGAIGGFFNQAITPRAGGGAVTGGAPYLVGEAGPELFIPHANGSIVPNGGSGVVINQSIVAQPGTSPADLHAVMVAARDSAIAAIDKRRRNSRGNR